MKKPICDGCNVREGHMHKCHQGPPINIEDREVNLKCECEYCSKRPTSESLQKWADAGHPNDFAFDYES